jgi:hypothetical protein
VAYNRRPQVQNFEKVLWYFEKLKGWLSHGNGKGISTYFFIIQCNGRVNTQKLCYVMFGIFQTWLPFLHLRFCVTNIPIFLIDAWPSLVKIIISGRIETDNLASLRIYRRIHSYEERERRVSHGVQATQHSSCPPWNFIFFIFTVTCIATDPFALQTLTVVYSVYP